ncbi:2,5-didehydrogluconate reductase DkgB [Celerinatantimonas yamalensis]|uniref:2,5-didehydrogluconate reductase DkgB n=1 Tax=Celerinatantimonas yamalensis TaxID=559956 RepID=A0ABW9G978_9GAMM
MNSIPALGAGTFRLKGDDAYNSVKAALAAGFRHIDTAQIYKNEEQVGQAIADSSVARDDIFLTTKVWMDNFAPARFIDSVRESLTKLQVEQVDLLLVHWPDESGKVAMSDYLSELAKAKQQGLTRHIGVSNFTIAQVDQAIAILGAGSLLTNQIEVHPFLQNRRLVEYCQQHGLTVTGYMPLAVGKVMEDECLQAIAKAHQTTPASVAIAWQLRQGLVTIPSSTKPAHLAANLAAANCQLSDVEMAQIVQLDRAERIANPDFAPKWDE